MNLSENDYENSALVILPHNARDLAEELIDKHSLKEFLQLFKNSQPDETLLTRFNVNETQWLSIIKAGLLVKSTDFLPSPNFTEREILYLIKAASLSIDYPLGVYTLNEILYFSKETHPKLYLWLIKLAELLLTKHNPSLS